MEATYLGFTALHWALVKGNYACIQKLVEYGADRTVQNNEGKTPSVTAREMNSLRQWNQALQANGYDQQGAPRSFPVPLVEDKRKFFWRFWYFLPFFSLWLGLWIMSSFPIFVGLPGTGGGVTGEPAPFSSQASETPVSIAHCTR